MNYYEEISPILNELYEEALEKVRQLVAIDSVSNDNDLKYPYGEGVAKVFEVMCKWAMEDCLSYDKVENHGGHICLGPQNTEELMGILCHLDIVPKGEGWTKEAFLGEIEDGKMYGRGTIDDKGPTVAVYMVMKALKRVGLDEKMTIGLRLILGLDEETNWKSLEAYKELVDRIPTFGFTPDGQFPIVYGEKAIIHIDLANKLSNNKEFNIRLNSIEGGNAPNMVPDWARAVIYSKDSDVYEGIYQIIDDMEVPNGFSIRRKKIGKSLELYVNGVSAHGSVPFKGCNAISLMMKILGKISFQDDRLVDFINFYNEKIGFETNGKGLGIDFEGKYGEKTTVNAGKIQLNQKEVLLSLDCRIPIDYTDEDIYKALENTLIGEDIGVIKNSYKPSIYVDINDKFPNTLMEVYKESTGDDTKPLIIGGGTYARAMKNFVAFGPLFPGEEEMAHKADEYIDLNNFKKMIDIYAKSICKICFK